MYGNGLIQIWMLNLKISEVDVNTFHHEKYLYDHCLKAYLDWLFISQRHELY